MTQSLVKSTDGRRRTVRRWERTPLLRALAAGAVSLVLVVVARPLSAQGQGEVQVTARVVPLIQTREAAIAFAANPLVPDTSHLFHITHLRRPGSARATDLKREELIVVVEFLAN